MLSVTGQSTAPLYDGRGNMTRDHQGQTYEYDHYNRLSGVGTSIDLAYDPAGRLQETSGTGITFREMQYDGLDLIAEYNGSGTLTARYVHGPGADEPLVQYAGASVSTRQWLLADERGSIVAVTDWSGAAIQINSYDEYGAPAPGNAGRFGYTGQVWLPETGLYHYKNRAYNPELGRFMQTDPIGVSGGMNLYAYVGGDPVNFVDPLGLRQEDTGPPPCNPPNCDVVTVTTPELDDPCRGFCMSYEDVLEALYGGDPWTIGVPVYDFYDSEGNYLGGASEQSCNRAGRSQLLNEPLRFTQRNGRGSPQSYSVVIPEGNNIYRLELSVSGGSLSFMRAPPAVDFVLGNLQPGFYEENVATRSVTVTAIYGSRSSSNISGWNYNDIRNGFSMNYATIQGEPAILHVTAHGYSTSTANISVVAFSDEGPC